MWRHQYFSFNCYKIIYSTETKMHFLSIFFFMVWKYLFSFRIFCLILFSTIWSAFRGILSSWDLISKNQEMNVFSIFIRITWEIRWWNLSVILLFLFNYITENWKINWNFFVLDCNNAILHSLTLTSLFS